jgi:hypothetical protein
MLALSCAAHLNPDMVTIAALEAHILQQCHLNMASLGSTVH